MKIMQNIMSRFILFYIPVLVGILLLPACENNDKNKFALSETELTLVENEQAVISVSGGESFVIKTNNDCIKCETNGTMITITGIKVGQADMTVTMGSEQLTCKITVERSAAQKDFEIFSTPRVENWMPETVRTEDTPGLQVSCEEGQGGETIYGFYFLETGEYCRLSADGDFTQRGMCRNGVVSMRNKNGEVQHYMCDKVEVVKVLNGRVWIVASFPAHPDLRIVTENF